jgi:hypothetical protein
MTGQPRHHHEGPGAYGNCRSCGAPIRWLLTPLNKYMPTDAANVGHEETHFDHKRHTSHFATCLQADMWRKPWDKKSPASSGA